MFLDFCEFFIVQIFNSVSISDTNVLIKYPPGYEHNHICQYFWKNDFSSKTDFNHIWGCTNHLVLPAILNRYERHLFITYNKHYFLAYLVGSKRLLQYATEGPLENLSTFVSLLIFTGVFYFVFSWFREQVCTIACPYGRLQSVLLDKNPFWLLTTINVGNVKKEEPNSGRMKTGLKLAKATV